MKALLLFSALFMLSFFVSAQIKIGLKAGLNLANISASPKPSDASYNIKPGLHAGGLVSIPIKGPFSLQPEIEYSGIGTKYKEFDGDTSNMNLGYINVPLLLKYSFKFGLFAELGPQIGFLLSAKQKFLRSSGNGNTNDIKSNYQSTDFSAVFGIGYLSKFNLGIDARYVLGMTNILKNGGGVYSAKNDVIQIGLFYVIDIAKNTKSGK